MSGVGAARLGPCQRPECARSRWPSQGHPCARSQWAARQSSGGRRRSAAICSRHGNDRISCRATRTCAAPTWAQHGRLAATRDMRHLSPRARQWTGQPRVRPQPEAGSGPPRAPADGRWRQCVRADGGSQGNPRQHCPALTRNASEARALQVGNCTDRGHGRLGRWEEQEGPGASLHPAHRPAAQAREVKNHVRTPVTPSKDTVAEGVYGPSHQRDQRAQERRR